MSGIVTESTEHKCLGKGQAEQKLTAPLVKRRALATVECATLIFICVF